MGIACLNGFHCDVSYYVLSLKLYSWTASVSLKCKTSESREAFSFELKEISAAVYIDFEMMTANDQCFVLVASRKAVIAKAVVIRTWSALMVGNQSELEVLMQRHRLVSIFIITPSYLVWWSYTNVYYLSYRLFISTQKVTSWFWCSC